MATAVAGTTPTEPGFEELATRVDRAVAAVAQLDAPARGVATELQAALEAAHRAGLVAIVRRLKGDPATRDALFELAADPQVAMLLSLHGILRPPPAVAAEQALAAVRPQLASHGGGVSLDRVEDGTAHVRLEGACNGCSMSAQTLRTLVEGALLDGVPGVERVQVMAAEPSPTLIPLEALRIGPDRAAEGWTVAGATADFPAGAVHPVRVAGEDLIVVNLDNRLSAYHNECAHEGLPLDGAVLDVTGGTLTCPWHGFCYDATSGECLSAPGAQLAALPMRVDAGQVWVRTG